MKIDTLFKSSLFCCFIYLSITLNAQELQAKVTVNSIKINTTVDKKIFNTLQTQLVNFINTRRWTNDKFNQNEKIECSFLLNLESIVETNVYKGSLVIQAARPVFNSSYSTSLLNFQDKDITFKYIEFQPIEFNENRVQGSDPLIANLSASIAYYVYMILGLDYDSFAPKGGDVFFQRALNIVNNSPEGNNINGWKQFDGLRSRYWFNENLVNSSNNVLHEVLYNYYHAALDKLYENEKEGRTKMLQALTQLKTFNTETPNSMFVQAFMQGKAAELIGIFKKATAEEKQKAIALLSILDIANDTRYKQELQ